MNAGVPITGVPITGVLVTGVCNDQILFPLLTPTPSSGLFWKQIPGLLSLCTVHLG